MLITKKQGSAVCICRTDGSEPLEGFGLGDTLIYRYGHSGGYREFYEVHNDSWPEDYWERCSAATFNRHFKKGGES